MARAVCGDFMQPRRGLPHRCRDCRGRHGSQPATRDAQDGEGAPRRLEANDAHLPAFCLAGHKAQCEDAAHCCIAVQVYHPCVLQTKKRYVGFMYESPDQVGAVT